MAKVHVVNHTHWDREWYFTTNDALVLSDSSFSYALDELERNPNATFCLDGQSSIIDEYIELRPERLEQVRKFVAEGRLSIGPWFAQTDTFLVAAESMVRNLMIGIRDSLYYGQYMNIGYLPDSFGFNAQIPTILANCGIESMISFRGIHFGKQVTSPYFIWEGLSGKKVIGINLVKGYGSAAFLEDSDVYIQNKLLPLTNLIKSKTDQDEILIPLGEDQLDILPDLDKKLAGISTKTEDTYVVSTYENFVEYLKTLSNLEEYQGEFREPVLSRVHKTIGSIRYDIKKKNFDLEQKFLYRVEPLMAIGRANDVDVSERLLSKAWKKLLESQAHDSMGGCVSDNVAVDILHRLKEADEIADSMENIITKRLAEKMGLQENEILVFNTNISPFSGYKNIQIVSPDKNIRILDHEDVVIVDSLKYPARDHVRIIDASGERYITEPEYYKLTVQVKTDIPAMGYTVLQFDNQATTLPAQKSTADHFIENSFYKISVEKNVLTLKTSTRKTFENFLVFEDCGNDGDTYDFSPLLGETATLLSLSNVSVEKADSMETMILEGTFTLPKNLEERIEKAEPTGTLGIKLYIHLRKDTDYIAFHCEVDNQIYSHRLRVRLNSEIYANETIASLPFGYIRREVLKELPENWENNYVEMPIDIETYESSVAVESDDFSFTAFGKGLKEYQFIDKNLYLTLFSSTNQLGKENLVYRPGRASGDTTRKGHQMIETPMAELIGPLSFDFAVRVNNGSFEELETAKTWDNYAMENVSYQVQSLNKFIYRLDNKIQPYEETTPAPKASSLFEIDGDVLFSCFTPSLYDSDSFILRLKNPTSEARSFTFKPTSSYSKVELVNYIEQPVEGDPTVIGPYDTITLKLS